MAGKVMNGTHYDESTPDEVVRLLESYRAKGRRIRVRYGDPKTGRDWLEEHDVEGTVGRSTGEKKVPLLIHNRRSLGGAAMLDHCVVRIIDRPSGFVHYSHPKYHRPTLTVRKSRKAGFAEDVLADGTVHARFRKPGQAARWVRKMEM